MRHSNARKAALLGCLLGGLVPVANTLAQDAGEAIFARSCAGCHGVAGGGIPGFAPALDRPAFWQSLGEDAPFYLGGVLVSGIAGRMVVDGVPFIGAMPRQAMLDDAELLAVSAYLFSVLGELDGVALDEETLAALRAQPPSHSVLLAMRPSEN